MKFLHTGDWQMGMKAARIGEAGRLVREERFQSATRVVEAANENQCDFLLVAGDTFEDNAVKRTIVQRVGDILAKFDGPVYIISGNHDPLVPGSVWDHPVWNASNLHVIAEAKPIQLEGGWLFPCPLFEKYSQSDPTHWIDASSHEGICIGVGHGTVEGVPQEEPDYPIPRNAADRSGLDYLGIGHWHSFATYPSPDGGVRLCYSGTHETTKFGERESGNAVLVEINAAGEKPKLTPIRTGGLSWLTWPREISQLGELTKIREAIEAIESPTTTLLSLRLSGLLLGEDQSELLRIKELLAADAGRFLYAEVLDELLPAPDDESWMEQVPPGLMQDVIQRLRSYASEGGDLPEHATREIASRAMLELYRIIESSRS
ncbi:MAG: DNA repair exonuclease [bacterium]|nr:DNA repair exonuclease [bacterium]